MTSHSTSEIESRKQFYEQA
ncbi:unnamed protein product, partial [Rotaria sordida]